MGDFSSGNSNLVNTVRGLKIFSGRVPSEFKDWRKQNCLVLSINRRDVYAIMKGQARPTTATGGSTATTGRSLAEQQEAYDRASHDLYAILFMVTQMPASLIVLKHEDATGTSGDGRKAWEELQDKYLKVTDETIRAKTAELAATAMKSGQDPDDYFTEAIIKRAEVEAMGEPMTDRRFKDILVQGFLPEYESIKPMMYRDPTFDLAQIQATMRHLYSDNLSRSNEAAGKIAGRGIAMSAESVVCYNRDKIGHISRNCPMPAKNNVGGYFKQGKKDGKKKPSGAKAGSGDGGGTKEKWCSVHKSTTHNDAECYQQGTPRPQGNAFTTAVIDAHTPLADDDQKPAVNFNDEFDGGLLWMASAKGRTSLPNSCGITMLVDSGATEHLLDDKLIPGLKDRMKNYALLGVPKTIVTAGNNELQGTATGIFYGTIVDQTGKKHRVRFPSFIVSGLGRNIFSSPAAMQRGVATILEAGNPHLRKGGVVVPLQQRKEDLGLTSFKVEIDEGSGASSPGIANALNPGASGASSPTIVGAASPGIDVAPSPEIIGSSPSRIIGASATSFISGSVEVNGASTPGVGASSRGAGVSTTAGASSPGARASSPGAGVSTIAGASSPGARSSSPGAGVSSSAGESSPGAEAFSSGAGATLPGITPAVSPGGTHGVSPGVKPTSTGVAPGAQHHVTTSAISGPTAEGTFTEGTFEVAYDELSPARLLNLTERAPRANPLDPGKSSDKGADFADTERDPSRVSEEENMVINHQDPLRGTTSPETFGTQTCEVIGASALGITGLPSHFGASVPGATGPPSPELAEATASGITGSTSSWITGASAGATASYGVAGSSPSGTTGASAELSSPGVDGSTTSASTGVAPTALELRHRAKLNTEDGCELKEVHKVMEGQPRGYPVAGSMDFAHGGGEPVLTSTAFVYTRKTTSGYLFFMDEGPISIGAKLQRLTA